MSKHSVIQVQLTTGGVSYNYFNHEPNVAVGDHVVVKLVPDAPRDAVRLTRFRVGVVTSTTPTRKGIERATKWIVCKLDTDKYDALTGMFEGES